MLGSRFSDWCDQPSFVSSASDLGIDNVKLVATTSSYIVAKRVILDAIDIATVLFEVPSLPVTDA